MAKHIGSTLDDFLDEEGLLAVCVAVAIKRVSDFIDTGAGSPGTGYAGKNSTGCSLNLGFRGGVGGEWGG